MLRSVFSAGICGALCACTPSGVQIALDFEDPSFGRDRIQSLILGVERGDMVDVVAIDWKTGEGLESAPLLVLHDGTSPVALTAFVYERTLAELGVAGAGTLPRAISGGGPIPPTRDLHARVVRGDDNGRWKPVALVSAALDGFRSAALRETADLCVTFDSEVLTLETQEHVRTTLALSDQSVLVVTGRRREQNDSSPPREAPQMYRITRRTFERVDEKIPRFKEDFEDTRITALAEDASKELWIATMTATLTSAHPWLWRGSLDRGFTRLPVSPFTSDINSLIARTPTASPGRTESVYALADSGGVQRFDVASGRWVVVIWGGDLGSCYTLGLPDTHPRHTDIFGRCGELFWRDESTLVVMRPDGRVVHFVRSTGRTTLSSPSGRRLSDIERTGLGVVAVDSLSHSTDFYVLDEDGPSWRTLHDDVVTLVANPLASFRGGFIFSGTHGYLTQVVPAADGSSFCPSQGGVANFWTLAFTPLGDEAFVMSGWKEREEPTYVVRIAPAPGR